MREETVLVITPREAAAAPQVLEGLGGLASEGGLEVRAAVVVHRTDEGWLEIEDHLGDVGARQSLSERHPRLATLLTVLAGPLDTLLLGNPLTALAGAVAEPTPDELALEQLARAIPPGSRAVVAVVEGDPDDLDCRMAQLGAGLLQRPLPRSRRRSAFAQEAVAAAGAQARHVLRRRRPTE